jgi:hypothetical protein
MADGGRSETWFVRSADQVRERETLGLNLIGQSSQWGYNHGDQIMAELAVSQIVFEIARELPQQGLAVSSRKHAQEITVSSENSANTTHLVLLEVEVWHSGEISRCCH